MDRFLEENESCYKEKVNDTYAEPGPGDDSSLCREVTVEEIDANLAKCKNRSAMGHDGIGYLLIKKLRCHTSWLLPKSLENSNS